MSNVEDNTGCLEFPNITLERIAIVKIVSHLYAKVCGKITMHEMSTFKQKIMLEEGISDTIAAMRLPVGVRNEALLVMDGMTSELRKELKVLDKLFPTKPILKECRNFLIDNGNHVSYDLSIEGYEFGIAQSTNIRDVVWTNFGFIDETQIALRNPNLWNDKFQAFLNGAILCLVDYVTRYWDEEFSYYHINDNFPNRNLVQYWIDFCDSRQTRNDFEMFTDSLKNCNFNGIKYFFQLLSLEQKKEAVVCFFNNHHWPCERYSNILAYMLAKLPVPYQNVTVEVQKYSILFNASLMWQSPEFFHSLLLTMTRRSILSYKDFYMLWILLLRYTSFTFISTMIVNVFTHVWATEFFNEPFEDEPNMLELIGLLIKQKRYGQIKKLATNMSFRQFIKKILLDNTVIYHFDQPMQTPRPYRLAQILKEDCMEMYKMLINM